MKKNSKTTIISITICLVLVLGLSALQAANWTPPSSTLPPGNNLPIPVNVTTIRQIKDQGLSVLGFTATGASRFAQGAFFENIIRGGSYGVNPIFPTTRIAFDKPLQIGGNGIGGKLTVDTVVNGNAEVIGNISSKPTLGNSTNQEVCADAKGTLILCGAPPPPPPPPPNQKIVSGKINHLCRDFGTPQRRHQGNAELTITFDAPTPEPLTLTLANCINPLSGKNYCLHSTIIPSIPPGYWSNPDPHNNQGITFTIPAGRTTYTTPRPLWSLVNNNSPYQPDHYSCIYADQQTHLYLRVDSPSGYTLKFDGTTNGGFANVATMWVQQIP